MESNNKNKTLELPPSWYAYCEEKSSFFKQQRTFSDIIIFRMGDMISNNPYHFIPSQKVYEMYKKDLQEQGDKEYNMDCFYVVPQFKIFMTGNPKKATHGYWRGQGVCLSGINVMDIASGSATIGQCAKTIRTVMERPMRNLSEALLTLLNANACEDFDPIKYSNEFELILETYEDETLLKSDRTIRMLYYVVNEFIDSMKYQEEKNGTNFGRKQKPCECGEEMD